MTVQIIKLNLEARGCFLNCNGGSKFVLWDDANISFMGVKYIFSHAKKLNKCRPIGTISCFALGGSHVEIHLKISLKCIPVLFIIVGFHMLSHNKFCVGIIWASRRSISLVQTSKESL